MKFPDSHPSDQQLLLDMEGELTARDEKAIRAHVEACWKCRVRRQELEAAIADFVHVHQGDFGKDLPSAAGPRALLKARLAQLTLGRSAWALRAAAVVGRDARASLSNVAASVCVVLALGLAVARLGKERNAAVVYMPDTRLTPGATILAGRPAVCAQPGAGNKPVPTSLQREVFREYGIPGADPRAYEVDYLVTPALGGADDIRNLWPHSHSAVWSARVKDALEDRLRDMVCAGGLDLTEAQREIAIDWVSAYKKYFHTDVPLPEHRK